MAQTPEGAMKVAAKRLGIPIETYKAKRANGEKRCYRCRSWKLVGEFGLDSTRFDGRDCSCLECRRQQYVPRKRGPSMLRGIKMSTKAKQKMSIAQTGPKNHQWKGGTSLSRSYNPEVRMARRLVNHAIEAGRLARPDTLPCFDCGKQAKEYHHYRGYSKANQLDVRAMCRKCHGKHHS